MTQLLARLDADEAAADREVDVLALAHAEAVQQPLAVAATKTPPRTSSAPRRCAFIDGFSLDANTVVDAADRPAAARKFKRGFATVVLRGVAARRGAGLLAR